MTKEEMVAWIDNASYAQLLEKWRFAPDGDALLRGEVGQHFYNVMAQKADQLPDEEIAKISKSVGWDTNEEVR